MLDSSSVGSNGNMAALEAFLGSPLPPVPLHPTPYTLNPEPPTLNSKPSTLNPQPSTLNPKL